MELRQLEAFAAVMSTGSVTAAGRLLGRSQPAISRLLQELEAEIGYALFSRSGPRVTPTEQGFLLYEDVERALAGMRQIRERAGEIARGQAQPLLIAATPALAAGLVPAALQRMQAGADASRRAADQAADQAAPRPAPSRPSRPRPHPAAQRLARARGARGADWRRPAGRDQPAAGASRPDGALDRSGRLRGRLAGKRSAGRARRGAGVGAGRPPAHHHGQPLPPAPPPGRRAGRQRAGRRHHRDQLVHQRAGRRAPGLGVSVLEPVTAYGTPMPGVAIRSIDLDIPFSSASSRRRPNRPRPPA